MAKIIGFKFITAENFIKAYNWIIEEGSCCLAYGDWTAKAIDLLLTDEQKKLHEDVDFEEFGTLDTEVIEAIVMLPVLKIIESESLYWNYDEGISTDYFETAAFGIDFRFIDSLIFHDIGDLRSSLLDGYISREVIVHISSDKCTTQQLIWNISNKFDIDILEDLLGTMIDLISTRTSKVDYYFEVK